MTTTIEVADAARRHGISVFGKTIVLYVNSNSVLFCVSVYKTKIIHAFYQSMDDEVAPQVGLEPTTTRLTAECSAIELLRNMESGGDLCFRAVSSQVRSALRGLTSVFGMGTGGTLSSLPPEMVSYSVAGDGNLPCAGFRPLPLGFPCFRFLLPALPSLFAAP